MNLVELGERLSANLDVFNAFFSGVDDTQMRWKPAPDRWSLLEVLNHLLDEEKADFRQALMNLIDDTALPWPNISPMEWVTSRSYNTKDPATTFTDFRNERLSSLAWLNGQDEINSEILHAGDHPFNQAMKAGDIKASWMAHDFFHIRQIVNLKWEYLMDTSKPYDCRYAGEY